MKRAFLSGLLFAVFAANLWGEVLFRDDFAGGKSPRWMQINDGTERGIFQTRKGSYTITSGDAGSSLPRAIVRSVTQKDYFLQADVRIRPISPGIAAASLLSYYTDSRHFYEFALDARAHYWYLRKVDKTGTALLMQGRVPGEPRSLFRLGLYVRQGNLRAFIDGVMVADEFDGRGLAGGAFGLSAQGAETQWDHVLVRTSNPLDFFYKIQAQKSNSAGKVRFSGTEILTTDESGKPLAGITVYRIRRDGLSYFVCHDPSNGFAPASGFLTEFEALSNKQYRIPLSRLSSTNLKSRSYEPYQLKWLQDFLRRSARLSPDHVTAELKTTRDLYLRDGRFVDSGNSDIFDSILGNPGEPAEVNHFLYGNWEDFGNYRQFPSISGIISSGDNVVRLAASAARVPGNSKFILHSLRLSAGGPGLALAWFVQDDSRAFVLVESADLPGELQAGKSYTVPITLLNTGGDAGAFTLSVVLSRNSHAGASDPKLAKRSFGGIRSGERIVTEMSIQVPAGTPDGMYFLATFLETPGVRTKLLRLHNGNFVKPVALGSTPAPGHITLSLSWNAAADLDLHASDPLGETIYYFYPQSTGGGNISRDLECSGTNEAITYPSGSAAAGTYQISIHYFRACGLQKDVSWTLTVESDKGTQTFSGVIHPGEFIRAAEYAR